MPRGGLEREGGRCFRPIGSDRCGDCLGSEPRASASPRRSMAMATSSAARETAALLSGWSTSRDPPRSCRAVQQRGAARRRACASLITFRAGPAADHGHVGAGGAPRKGRARRAPRSRHLRTARFGHRRRALGTAWVRTRVRAPPPLETGGDVRATTRARDGLSDLGPHRKAVWSNSAFAKGEMRRWIQTTIMLPRVTTGLRRRGVQARSPIPSGGCGRP